MRDTDTRHAERARAISSPWAASSSGSPSVPSTSDRALPGQVVQPDVVERHRLRRRRRAARRSSRWNPIATLHSPIARCPASSSARVTMPTGLVKSMIHAPGAARRRARSAMSQHDRHGAQRLGEPARPGGLLPDAAELERPGLVPVPGRLAADPQLEQHRAGAVQAVVQVGGPADGRPGARAPRMIRAENGPTTSSRACRGPPAPAR